MAADNDRRTFGEWLRFFRQRARLTQAELAALIELPRANTLGDWERGQLPSKSLDYIGQIIEVLELDEKDAQCLQDSLALAVEPRPRRRVVARGWTPPLIGGYVTRPVLEEQLIQALTTARVVVLYGATGLGKSTLATRVTRLAAVGEQFGAGVLWVDAAQPPAAPPYEYWCGVLGIMRRPGESWAAAWQRWTAQSERRWLVVLDDVVEAAAVQPLLAHLGAAAAVLATTQDGALAQQLTGPWTATEVTTLAMPPWTPQEGRALLEAALGRELTTEEWPVVQRIGELLGWHPAALRLTLWDGQAGAWEELLADLERAGGGHPLGISAWLQRQWTRLGQEVEKPQRTELLEQLWYWMRDKRPFGVGYAAAAWQVPEAVARRYLRQLELTGLVEPLAEPDPGGFGGALWRTLPVAQGVLWRPRPVRRWDQYGWPRGRLGRALMQTESPRWRLPWWLRFIAANVFMLAFPFEMGLWLLAWLWERVFPRRPLPDKFSRSSWWLGRLLKKRTDEPGLPLEYLIVRDWGSLQVMIPGLLLLGGLLLLYAVTGLVNGLVIWVPHPPRALAVVVQGYLDWLLWFVGLDLFAGPGWLWMWLGSVWLYAWWIAPVNLAHYRLSGTQHWRYRLLVRLARWLSLALPTGWAESEAETAPADGEITGHL